LGSIEKQNAMRIVQLMTCATQFEASLIQGRLENEQIASFLTNQNFSTLMPNYYRILGSGVQVMVFEDDLEKAQILLGMNITVELVCPACGSANIKPGFGRNGPKMIFAVLLSLFSTVPFNNINMVYRCKDCGTRF
jgi:transposase-like protein